MPAMPASEFIVDEKLVRGLLVEQYSELAGEVIQPAGVGWDNAIYRVGEELAMRLPRRSAAVEPLVREQRWIGPMATRLPVPIPTPVYRGRPTRFYPWPWSLVKWLRGETVDRYPLAHNQASLWARFLRALHQRAPADAPHNPYRGVPLQDRSDSVQGRLRQLSEQHISIAQGPLAKASRAEVLSAIWQQALSAEPGTCDWWIHGDLHPLNVLSRGGRLAGVIDWGDLTRGDPATDLASVWMLFDDATARHEVLRKYSADEPLVQRARGWAIFFGSVWLADPETSPHHAAMGESTLRRVINDWLSEE